MSVHLVPDKNLHFHGPFTQPVQTTLTITNENPTSVAFKVKTTRPKLYTTRPNRGRIEPGDSMEVTITLLRPVKEKRRSSPTHHGKFLIQSAFIKPEYGQDLQCIWNVPHTAGCEWRIHEQKLLAIRLPSPDEMRNANAFSIKCKYLLSAVLRFSLPKVSWASLFASPFSPAKPPPSCHLDISNHDESRNKLG